VPFVLLFVVSRQVKDQKARTRYGRWDRERRYGPLGTGATIFMIVSTTVWWYYICTYGFVHGTVQLSHKTFSKNYNGLLILIPRGAFLGMAVIDGFYLLWVIKSWFLLTLSFRGQKAPRFFLIFYEASAINQTMRGPYPTTFKMTLYEDPLMCTRVLICLKVQIRARVCWYEYQVIRPVLRISTKIK
jgi:hypothetical protein